MGIDSIRNNGYLCITMTKELSITMKMAELLEQNPSLLGVFTRMGFTFGYGDATVEECAKRQGRTHGRSF